MNTMDLNVFPKQRGLCVGQLRLSRQNTFACLCPFTGNKSNTHTHTCSHAASLAAASLPWTTSRLWAPEEMTGLSLISLSSAQTSPNYSHCLPLRWHAPWIIDGRPCPSQLKGLASGHSSSQWTGRPPTKRSCVSCMTVDWIIIPPAICFCFVFSSFPLAQCTGLGAAHFFVSFLPFGGPTCWFCFSPSCFL